MKKNLMIPDMIQEIKKISQSYINDTFKNEKIHSSHIFYILCLKRHGILTQKQLSSETKNDKAHTNRIIGQLLKDNLIEIEDPTLQRNQKLKLTESGIKIAEKMEKEIKNWFKNVTQGIKNEDLETTYKTIFTMLENCKKLKKGEIK